MAHGEAASISPSGKAVILAAVDLHLVFEKAVIKIARDAGGCKLHAGAFCEGGFNFEGLVRQAAALRLRHHGLGPSSGDAPPSLRQGWENACSIPILLWGIGGGRLAIGPHHLAEAVRVRKIAK